MTTSTKILGQHQFTSNDLQKARFCQFQMFNVQSQMLTVVLAFTKTQQKLAYDHKKNIVTLILDQKFSKLVIKICILLSKFYGQSEKKP